MTRKKTLVDVLVEDSDGTRRADMAVSLSSRGTVVVLDDAGCR